MDKLSFLRKAKEIYDQIENREEVIQQYKQEREELESQQRDLYNTYVLTNKEGLTDVEEILDKLENTILEYKEKVFSQQHVFFRADTSRLTHDCKDIAFKGYIEFKAQDWDQL